MEFEKRIGVRPVFGGYHATQGTKNALINLNDGCYLELLAIDTTNKDIKPPRWMGVDVLTKNKLTRVALKSNSLQEDSIILKEYNSEMGTVNKGLRKTTNGNVLQWELIMPLATPEVEIVPFLIDWSKSEIHTSNYMADMRCELVEIYATHPNPEKYMDVLESLNFDMRVKTDKEVALKAILKTPLGIIHI